MVDTKILDGISADLIMKYNIRGPYYTSYPTQQNWSDITHDNFLKALNESFLEGYYFPLSLYLHFPFCPMQCYYCFCHNIVAKDREKIKDFLKHLALEIKMWREFFQQNSLKPKIKEVHLGGGSPSFMNEEELDFLIDELKSIGDFSELDEFTIEIDVRTVDKDKLKHYHKKSINRISLGVQDLDIDVQKAVNRVQPLESIQNLLTPEIRGLFKSINFDLIYGLPKQSRKSFKETIETTKKVSPDRFSVYNYDHRPDIYKHQALINSFDIPDSTEKMMIFVDAIRELINSGYIYIGIDHFVKPTDTLAKAIRNRTLGRDFNGYNTGRSNNLLGLGPTSLSSFGKYYFQNIKSLHKYYRTIQNKKFPVVCGYKLNKDDLIRRSVIIDLICKNFVDFSEIEKKYNIVFSDYFKTELSSLGVFVEDKMLKFSDKKLTVTLLGRIFVRHICRAFDKYS